MPVFGADLLPDATGRNLGNASQRWNAFLQSLDLQGGMNYQPVSGAPVKLGGAIYVATAPITANVNMTGAQLLLTYFVPAGLLNAAGKVLRATMAGTYTTQSGQTPIFSMSAILGGIRIFFVSTDALAAGQPSNTWRAQWEFAVYVPGSSAQIDPHGTMAYQTTSGVHDTKLVLDVNTTAASPIDLTVGQPLQCQCAFTTNTSPANVCIQREFIVEVLN